MNTRNEVLNFKYSEDLNPKLLSQHHLLNIGLFGTYLSFQVFLLFNFLFFLFKQFESISY